jgi:hypothetical protein
MTHSTAECEVIGLCICLEAVNDIANRALLSFRESEHAGGAEAIFDSSVHRDLFLIRLLDFVKESGSAQLTGVKGSCLAVLRQACATKSFDIGGSVSRLTVAVDALQSWLEHKKKMTLWLPTLDVDAMIEVSRLDFLSITGNHSKHNLSRLTGVSADIGKILNKHGYVVEEELIPLALDDFSEHLAENYFVYYGSWLAEMMNNLRWGMQSYLEPTFAQAYKADPEIPGMYGYECPIEIQSAVGRVWFWRLMNHVRARPYLTPFSTSSLLKRESSLEWDE